MGWWILAGVVALLLLLAVSRVRMLVSFQDTFQFEVRFWFFKFRLPGKPSAKKPKPVKAKPAKKEAEKEQAKPNLSFFLSHVSELVDLLKNLLTATGRRLVMDRLYLNLRIHEEDAAATAIRYGQACAVVYTATGFLGSALRVRRHDIHITPLFQEGTTSVAFSAALSIRIFSMVTLAVTQGPAVVKLMLSYLHRDRDTTLQKDGAVS